LLTRIAIHRVHRRRRNRHNGAIKVEGRHDLSTRVQAELLPREELEDRDLSRVRAIDHADHGGRALLVGVEFARCRFDRLDLPIRGDTRQNDFFAFGEFGYSGVRGKFLAVDLPCVRTSGQLEGHGDTFNVRQALASVRVRFDHDRLAKLPRDRQHRELGCGSILG
jgi:hypothetical protein